MYKEVYNRNLNSYLNICSGLIAQKMNMPIVYDWSDSGFIKLSAVIGRETKIHISKNTLKRVFGKLKTDDSYCPQKATLDALAVYLGYTDWEGFKQASMPVVNQETSVQPTPVLHHINDEVKIPVVVKRWLRLLTLAIILLLFAALTLFFKYKGAVPYASLTCLNPEGKQAYSAVFNFAASLDQNDTTALVIDFNDRITSRVALENKQIIHRYETPGWYKAILKYKNRALDTAIVKVKSAGWFAYATGPVGIYGRHLLKTFNGTVSGMKGFTKTSLAKAGTDTLKPVFVNFANIKNTTINGDNFEMKARVKMADDVKDGNCAHVHFSIYGETYDDYLGITSPGCTAWADADFSEQIRTGLWEDLSMLAKDLSNGGNVLLRVKNKKVNLYVNNKCIYATTYKKSLGKVSGVRILFSGLGEVYAFSMHDIGTGESF